MKEKPDKLDRRGFLKTVTGAGLGAVLTSAEVIPQATASSPNDPNTHKTQAAGRPAHVPKRKLGKTDTQVSSLALGTNRLFMDAQVLLRKAFEYGVTYWDSSPVYAGGNSERAIGRFLARNPQARERLFLSTKAWNAQRPEQAEKSLRRSLKTMKTEYIDLFYGIHELYHPAQLSEEMREWSKSAKQRGLIRYFGFSTHKNMSRCLTAAAKLDWIDAVITAYNFRLMQDAEMTAAVEACYKAGVALTAMKTQGHGQEIAYISRCSIETEQDKKLIDHFLQSGLTEGQAKIRLVLDDKRISSACVGMSSMALLRANVAAAAEKTELSRKQVDLFGEYARATSQTYCAGCAHICDSLLPEMPYLSDVMRSLMYYNSYGDKQMARALFAEIGASAVEKLASADYSRVEEKCPQRLPVARFVSEALRKLA